MISSCGTCSNALSLFYFIKKEEKSLGNKLLMLLNCLDLFFCFNTTVRMVLFWNANGSSFEKFASAMTQILLVSTAFATCLLSVTRSISLCFPFYRVNGKAIISATVIFISYLAITQVLYYTIYIDNSTMQSIRNYTLVGTLLLIIVVVIVSNVISVVALLRTNDGLGERRITEVNVKMSKAQINREMRFDK